MRLSELLSLDICDIDKNNGMVKVIGKGNKERIVPIGKVALNSIKKYLETQEGPLGQILITLYSQIEKVLGYRSALYREE